MKKSFFLMKTSALQVMILIFVLSGYFERASQIEGS